MISVASLRSKRLGARWFHRDPATIARALLGCALVHGDRAAMIVETEAYLGPEDLASHARFGPTSRTSVMFGPGGVSYVYLCYGMHQMFNIVAGRDGEPGAVLVRAAAPLVGLDPDPGTLRGPGKLTKAMKIGRAQDRVPLIDDALFVARHARPRAIAVGPRIGVDYARDWAARPLRFWIEGHASVSKVR
ncbi:MAG TPA: DNA-3-methyladenine glycosylase [Kofleriaceae bacterium]|nr:DNA-3-methyladenine glycosylase [Kofleriaceae bacterium]